MKQIVDAGSNPDYPPYAAYGPLTLLPEGICASGGRCYQFGPFTLEVTGRILLHQGQMVPLPPKAAHVLLLLVENAGKVLEKEVLLKKAWPGTFTEEGSLTRTVSVLRKALRNGSGGQEYITTISKCGYRFLAPVTSGFTSPASGGHAGLMLAVLPFANLSGDPEQEHLCDGLTEEATMQLSRLNPRRLSVIARTSAMKYKLTTKNVAEIGEELGAAFLLEGSVRRADKRVRIAAQLIRVADQIHVWSESYQSDLGDILALQSDVAQAIARQIETRLTGDPM